MNKSTSKSRGHLMCQCIITYLKMFCMVSLDVTTVVEFTVGDTCCKKDTSQYFTSGAFSGIDECVHM